ncbi:MAG: HIT family protein [Bacteroidales bacterium]|nr:HIT family protein [Bacteroidales bacterium]
MASIFSRIVQGEIPCYKVAETADCLAFLDVNPIAVGHVLCIPKREVDYIFDMDEALFVAMQLFSRKVAQGLKRACPCIKVGMAVIGIDVPHAHIHLVPINKVSDMDFSTHVKLSDEEMRQLADRIAQCVEL